MNANKYYVKSGKSRFQMNVNESLKENVYLSQEKARKTISKKSFYLTSVSIQTILLVT